MIELTVRKAPGVTNSDLVLKWTEREIVQACQEADRDAFGVLFETYKDRVYSIALRFSGEPADAMDVAQETFLKLFARIQSFRMHSKLETLIYRIVVNNCLDRVRRRRRVVPLTADLVATLGDTGNNPSHALLRAEMLTTVQSAVDSLMPDLRMVIVLRYTQELAYEQIADVLGCSAGTVASRLNRAHRLLKQTLAGTFVPPVVSEPGDACHDADFGTGTNRPCGELLLRAHQHLQRV